MKPVEIMSRPSEIVIRKGYGYRDLPKLDFEEEEIIKVFDEKHSQYKKLAKEILLGYEYATNNYFVLYIEALRTLDLVQVTSGKDNFVIKIPRDKVKFIPSPETVSRASRSLILEARRRNDYELWKRLVPQNKMIFMRRIKREKTMREYFGRLKQERLI